MFEMHNEESLGLLWIAKDGLKAMTEVKMQGDRPFTNFERGGGGKLQGRSKHFILTKWLKWYYI